MRLPASRRAREPVHDRERRHVGVAGLLLTLILIPLGGMIALGVSVISTRANAVRHATHVSQGLARVSALIGLRQALHAEAMATDVTCASDGSRRPNAPGRVGRRVVPIFPDGRPDSAGSLRSLIPGRSPTARSGATR